MCEGGSGQPGGNGTIMLDSGDALKVLSYNIPGGRRV
jgi:hypothetical protein